MEGEGARGEDGEGCSGVVPVCFVEDYELLAALGEGDFLLGEAFDAAADYVDAFWGLSESVCSSRSVACIPRSSLALSSKTASLYASPRSWRARHSIDVVFPIPGIPEMITCGMLPSLAMILSRSTVSTLPTMSSR